MPQGRQTQSSDDAFSRRISQKTRPMESESAYHIKSLFLQGSYRACVATAESSAQGDQASQLYAAREQQPFLTPVPSAVARLFLNIVDPLFQALTSH